MLGSGLEIRLLVSHMPRSRDRTRVTRYDREIDMGDRYGRSDVNEISIGISIWDMSYRTGIWYIDMVIYHIDMVILHIDMGYLVILTTHIPCTGT